MTAGCSRCKTDALAFLRTRFRCRVCRALVCSACSCISEQLPIYPALGQVRVCDACASTHAIGRIGGDHSEHSLEHAHNVRRGLLISRHLVEAFVGQMDEEEDSCRQYRRSLLQFLADASGDWGLFDQKWGEGDGGKPSFVHLQEAARPLWLQVFAVLHEVTDEEGRVEAVGLEGRCKSACSRLETLARLEHEALEDAGSATPEGSKEFLRLVEEAKRQLEWLRMDWSAWRRRQKAGAVADEDGNAKAVFMGENNAQPSAPHHAKHPGRASQRRRSTRSLRSRKGEGSHELHLQRPSHSFECALM